MKPPFSLFVPFKTKRAFEEIADQIRHLIYTGVFKPGHKLPPERELASQFNAGRMVVREALRTLEHSGLICVKQGSLGGAFIKEIDASVIKKSISDMIKIGNITIQNLTEVRLGIESNIIELAVAKRTNEDLALLQKNIEKTRQQVLEGIRPSESNVHFHLLLAKASKNFLFEVIIESVMDAMHSFLLSIKPDAEYIKRILRYHEGIYQAIMDKNVSLAKAKMEEHLLDIRRKLSNVKPELS